METSISTAKKNIAKNKARNSSIELLRIIAACMVVVLHYNGRALSVSSSLSHHLLALLECFSVCAVDLFIIISGYFLCKTQKRTWGKPAYLFLILSLIVSITYIIKSYIEGGINWITVIHSIIPPKNYFVLLYVTLYIISPYINLLLNRLTDNSRTVFILVSLMLFSFYPTFIDLYQSLVVHGEVMGTSTVGAWGQQHGYNIVNFALCYCLGAYIRLNGFNERIKGKNIAVILFACLVLLFAWFEVWLTKAPTTAKLIDCLALSYSNPLVLTIGVMLLITFSRIHFESRLVNTLAKAAFVCYLFHLEIIGYLRIVEYAQLGGWKLLLHLAICVVAIYLTSWCLWQAMELIVAPIVKWLDRFSIMTIQESRSTPKL